MVRSIGADHVIDYTQEDFTRNGQHYDLIFDTIGNRSVSDYKRALSSNGICAIAGFKSIYHLLPIIVLGSWASVTGSKKIGLMETSKPNQKDLVFIKELIDAGKIKPIIDRRYPLIEVTNAIRYLEKGHTRGKVVITIEH
jgi:NADPH:quinone reductase-like Zn-dependent oxidoreductase